MKTDIVDLIGESVRLTPQRGGKAYVGLCPFHDDHNPSMQVSRERQSYRCWVCNEGGDCFSFVMKHEHLDFRETLEMLARRANIEIPTRHQHHDSSTGENKPLHFEVAAWAEEQFHHCLLHDGQAERARRYFRERHFGDETIREFKLGFHPHDWEWLQKRAAGRYTPEQLSAVKLIKPRESGNGYADYFVDRVMFPIRDERGRAVAFGGRILPDSPPSLTEHSGKYFNSLESPIFQKSKLVFGLHHAREAIRRTNCVAVVEGYTDCIKCHQAGVRNVVATLGTALTENHVSLLKRFSRKVVLIYDGDKAGRDAASRAVEKFLVQDVDLRILTIPDELDPDEFLDEHGSDAMCLLIDRATDACDYQLNRLIESVGVGSIDSRLQILEEMLRLIGLSTGMSGSLKESLLLSRLSTRLSVPEGDIRKRLKEIRSTQTRQNMSVKVRNPSLGEADSFLANLQKSPTRDDLLECDLLQILLTSPDMIRLVRAEIGTDDFQNDYLREILAICFDLDEEEILPSFDKVVGAIERPDLKAIVVWLDDRALATRGAVVGWSLSGSSLAVGTPARVASTKAEATRAADLPQGNLPLGKLPDGSAAGGSTPETAEGGLLKHLLNEVKWRRQCSARVASFQAADDRPVAGSSDDQLTEETRLRLEEVMRFHRERMSRKDQAS